MNKPPSFLITFPQKDITPYESEFTTYSYTSITTDYSNLRLSSTGITTERYYYHTNHLGSVIALTNGSGDIVQSYSYDSFGKAYVISGSGTGTGTLTPIENYTGNTYSNTRLYPEFISGSRGFQKPPFVILA